MPLIRPFGTPSPAGRRNGGTDGCGRFASRDEHFIPLIRPCGTPSPGGEGMTVRTDLGVSRAEMSACHPPHPSLRDTFSRGEKDDGTDRSGVLAAEVSMSSPSSVPAGHLLPRGEGMTVRTDLGVSRTELSMSSPSSVPAGHLLPRGEGMTERRRLAGWPLRAAPGTFRCFTCEAAACWSILCSSTSPGSKVGFDHRAPYTSGYVISDNYISP